MNMLAARCRKALLCVGIAMIFGCFSQAQKPSIPVGYQMCMDGCYTNQNKNFGIWIFNGKTTGTGKWSTSASKAKLTITRYTRMNIDIHDVNPPGSSEAGLVGDYFGTISGDRIEGHYTLTWQGFNTPDHTSRGMFWAMVPETTCDSDTTPQQALDIAKTAIDFEQNESAFRCYKMSAEKGVGIAEFYVGVMYRDHIGTETDEKEALKWLTQAAHQRVYDAEVAMWQTYAEGIGVDANPPEAKKWFNIALTNPEFVRKNDELKRAETERRLQYDLAGKVLGTMGDAFVTALMNQ